MTSKITRNLIAELTQRDAHGRKKYGVTLDRTDLSLSQWLQHAKEELLDGAGYIEKMLVMLAQAQHMHGMASDQAPSDPVATLRALLLSPDGVCAVGSAADNAQIEAALVALSSYSQDMAELHRNRAKLVEIAALLSKAGLERRDAVAMVREACTSVVMVRGALKK